jgi:hypothetical protein
MDIRIEPEWILEEEFQRNECKIITIEELVKRSGPQAIAKLIRMKES